MIRPARPEDIQAIADTYTQLLLHEQTHGSYSQWVLNVYPTIEVPQEKVPAGEMFVLEDHGQICGSMVLNQEQAKEYATLPWKYPADPSQVMVIHTLCIPTEHAHHGYGTAMVNFAKEYARTRGCTVLRIDTNVLNIPAQHLYRKNGFETVGTRRCLHMGKIETELLYLEYLL